MHATFIGFFVMPFFPVLVILELSSSIAAGVSLDNFPQSKTLRQH